MDAMDTFMTTGDHTYDDDYNNESLLLTSAVNRSRLLLNEITSTSNHHNQANVTLLSTTATSNVLSNQSGIYTEFKIKTNDYLENNLKLNDLLKSYQQICIDHYNYLEKYQQSNYRTKSGNTTTAELDDLEKESQIWNLLNLLYADTCEHTNNDEATVMDLEHAQDDDENEYYFKNEAKLIEKLTKKNFLLRRLKLINNWLEFNSKKNLELIKHKLSSFTQKFSWEHTLHQLNSKERKLNVNTNIRDYVSELDPDAPIRQKKSLHDLDQEDEHLIMEYIYSFIRAGDLESVRKLTLKLGHSWRAATFEGFKYFNDFNVSHLNETRDNNEIKLNEGNLNRDIWRLVVSKMINNDNINPYEKAAYGSLAGFVRPVLPVCKTYYDYLWVYFKALYNNLIEKELRINITTREYDRLGMTNNDDLIPKSAKQIFDEIRTIINNSNNNYLKAEIDKPYSIILKHLIISGIDGFQQGTSDLLDYIKTIAVTERRTNGQFFRFSAHLSLFYRFASFSYRKDTFVNILELYVRYLIDNQYKELVAFYLSKLPYEMQIKIYSKFLETITNADERAKLIKIARSVNMDTQAITLNIVENLSRTNDDDLTATLSTTIGIGNANASTSFMVKNKPEFLTFKSIHTLNEEDRKKIDGLDWIISETAQRVHLLQYANAIMRYFLLLKQNLDAIKLVLAKIPHDTLNVILSQHKAKHVDDLNGNIQAIIKEYICFKEYIDAMNSFNEWLEYYNQKPSNPSSAQDTNETYSASFADRIAHDYQQKQFDDLLMKWNARALELCDKTRRKFLNILTFPNGGWMVNSDLNKTTIDGIEDDDMEQEENESKRDDNVRDEQLKAIRKLYIPYMCFVLCELLNKMNLYKELINVSDVCASELYQLYKLFDKSQLKLLLNKISNASIQLIDVNCDFLGFSTKN